jgi:hypothetical protein
VEEGCEIVGLDDFGEHLPRAVVAVEDRHFYDHRGVDFEGVARAAWTDLRAWEVQEGGSTITEPLMKNLYVPEGEQLEVSFWRRFVQSALAFSHGRQHTERGSGLPGGRPERVQGSVRRGTTTPGFERHLPPAVVVLSTKCEAGSPRV